MTDPIHVRSIRAEATRVGPDLLEVTGRLVDDRPLRGPSWFGVRESPTIHDMSITLRVRYPGLVIEHASARMATHPYRICTEAVPPLEQLVGLSVARGFTRAVNERFGRERGCAHLTALLHAMAPVIMQAAGAAFRDEATPPSPGDDWFVNTCHAWREGGPLVERLRAGDIEGLRALSARRMRETAG